jgi:hypothetical protein
LAGGTTVVEIKRNILNNTFYVMVKLPQWAKPHYLSKQLVWSDCEDMSEFELKNFDFNTYEEAQAALSGDTLTDNIYRFLSPIFQDGVREGYEVEEIVEEVMEMMAKVVERLKKEAEAHQ